MKKTQAHAKPVQLLTLKLCKYVVRPRGHKGQEPPRESDPPERSVERKACAGLGHPGKGERAGDKDGPSGAEAGSAPKRREPAEAAVLAQRLRHQGPQTPRCNSSPARRRSPPRRSYWPPGRPRTPEEALPDRRRRPAGQLLGLEPRRRRRRAPNGREGGGSGASPRGPSGSFETACLRSRPPVRGRAPSRHLPGPTPSQRPPALGPSAEAALPPVRGLKWLRNKENLGSDERWSDWPGGGARRGNVRRRSPRQRRRGGENRGLGLLGPLTCGRRRAPAVAQAALQPAALCREASTKNGPASVDA